MIAGRKCRRSHWLECSVEKLRLRRAYDELMSKYVRIAAPRLKGWNLHQHALFIFEPLLLVTDLRHRHGR